MNECTIGDKQIGKQTTPSTNERDRKREKERGDMPDIVDGIKSTYTFL